MGIEGLLRYFNFFIYLLYKMDIVFILGFGLFRFSFRIRYCWSVLESVFVFILFCIVLEISLFVFCVIIDEENRIVNVNVEMWLVFIFIINLG